MSFLARFNLCEGIFWILLAGVCFWGPVFPGEKNAGRRRALGIFLVLFGISDFVEMKTGGWWRPWWLLAWKATCLVGILHCWEKGEAMKSFLITVGQLLFAVFMYLMGSVFFGAALMPGLVLLFKVWDSTLTVAPLLRFFYLGTTIALGYFMFGLTLLILVGLFRTTFRLRLKEGNYPLFSKEALKWAFISSLYLMVHYTFIDFILLTPFANLLFRLLGAKLGKNVQFNSKYIFDASLLEIGDNTVIGGGAIIDGHMVERGLLKLRKVKIGSNVLIGSHATVMPGCEIGDRAIIGASAVLLKDTKVNPREVWFGIPAEPVNRKVTQPE